ncbi:hypothetical protein ACIBSW_11415 [Actinoplanes sp. NPDC049668]|uniref:hypothetical protein n=1 Tax=unclassified Actinoplanes TaxID=2626549 RepID=UPI00339E9C63
MLIDPDLISTLLAAAVFACRPHPHTERRAHWAGLRPLLADGDTLCQYVNGYGPSAEQQLIRRGARDFAVRADQSARRGPARLRPALTGLAGLADELARSAAFPSSPHRAAVQDQTVRALAAAIDRLRIDLASLARGG